MEAAEDGGRGHVLPNHFHLSGIGVAVLPGRQTVAPTTGKLSVIYLLPIRICATLNPNKG
jgi:hypothetical protein